MSRGKVYLVGAGPGDPDLLTLKALSILRTVDVVLHDDLVAPEILSLIRTPRVISVGKRCGMKRVSQEEINSHLIALASGENIVARLKAGDPLLFARAAEEIAALRAAAIEFEIIPGVMSASAAAAAAKIPLTDRHSAPHLMFLTAHHCSSRQAFAAATISPETTVVVHMPGTDYGVLSRDLAACCIPESSPCLIVSCASQSNERIQQTTLRALPHTKPLPSPAILIIGNVARLYYDKPDNCEQRAVGTRP